MQINKHKVVEIEYILKDDKGNVLDTSEGSGPFIYLHGANSIIPGLENALEGKSTGDQFSVTVVPEEGYGARDETKIATVPHKMFHDDQEIQVGMQYHAQGPNGEALTVTVVEVTEEGVVVDGNHPLAGENLNFDVTVKEVRDASEEEIAHGHVHGAGGHAHE